MMRGPVIPAPILHEKRKIGFPLTFRFTVYLGFAIQMVEGDSALLLSRRNLNPEN
jgi:hypothetical protein